jgi:hypothetical protein
MKGIKMVKKAGVIVSVLAGMSLTPLYASDMSYSYVEVGYIFKHDTNDHDGDGGFKIDGSYQITDNIFAFGSYDKWDFEKPKPTYLRPGWVQTYVKPKVTKFQIGGGYIFPLHENWDLYGAASLIRSEWDAGKASEDKTSLGIKAGVRGMVIPKLEVRASAGLDNTADAYDANKFIGEIGTSFYFIPSASVGLDVSFGGGIRMMLGGRYSF